MKIYTKTGDKGETSLFSGGRVKKSDLRIRAYGSIDELNSFIGLLAAYDINVNYKEVLQKIQQKLYNIGSVLAVKEKTSFSGPKITQADTELLEKEIDNLNNNLPPIKDFIIPGGNIITAQCHICRSICRRTEREVVELAINEEINIIVLEYLNRLSDYLFVLGRMVSQETKADEVVWKP
ncbi:MAG: cob(I)yrinic acid a,c-diamide adenosyltransferase [Bacteroidales bacterium]|nr:cob(I)yrinic acid a,c-diamide adenosyltransferase [Bacteroidales bacterium]